MLGLRLLAGALLTIIPAVLVVAPGCTASQYEPCAGKSEGDECRLCAPDDPDCVETMVIKICRADGTCGARLTTEAGAAKSTTPD